VSWWKLDGGLNATAADTENKNPALIQNAVWCWSLKCLDFGVKNACAETAHAAVNTAPGDSFTVSALVWLTPYSSSTAIETMVSQDAGNTSTFFLQFLGNNGNDSWAFSRVGARAVSNTQAQANTWTYLAGVFDASNNQLSVYVDGVLSGTQTLTTPPSPTSGPLIMGREEWQGADINWFGGLLSDVQVYQTALNTKQINAIPAYKGYEQ
jgi:hypothetical protein